MTRFAVTWDYRCPFARNAHEHVVTALRAGAPWEVEFVPFSLAQVHVEEGGVDVWDDPDKASGLLAMEVGLAVRRLFPERFLDAHIALFAARHDRGLDIRERDVLHAILDESGISPVDVFADVVAGGPHDEFHKAHDKSVAQFHVFGVPTFVVDDKAVFVRLMTRPGGDAVLARATIDTVLDLIDSHAYLNEFKHTTVPK